MSAINGLLLTGSCGLVGLGALMFLFEKHNVGRGCQVIAFGFVLWTMGTTCALSAARLGSTQGRRLGDSPMNNQVRYPPSAHNPPGLVPLQELARCKS